MAEFGRDRRSGEQAARFEAIFEATHARVLAFALRRVGRRDLAEDVVSETYLVAWRRLDVLPEEPLPWLLGTARKVLGNQRRSVRRRTPDGPPAASESLELADPGTPLAERVAERDAFATAFAKLGPNDREALTLVAWDGLEAREAAEVVGCTAAVFSLRLHRARRRLLKELAASGHSLGDGASPARSRPGTAEA